MPVSKVCPPWRWLLDRGRRARDRRQLRDMSERELRDIGLDRADIERIVSRSVTSASPRRQW